MKLYTEEQLFEICKYIVEQTQGTTLESHNVDELKQMISECSHSQTKLSLDDSSWHGSLERLVKNDEVKEIPMKVSIKKHELLEISEEELSNRYSDSLTVGELKKAFEKHKLPDTAKVLVERVQDFYFENNHWSVFKYGGYWYWSSVSMNKKIDSGVFNDKEQYPKMTDPEKYRTSEKELHEMKSQYHPASCCFKVDEHPEVLFINQHI